MNKIKLWLINLLFPKQREIIVTQLIWDEHDAKTLMSFLNENPTGKKVNQYLTMEENAMTDIAVQISQNLPFEAGKATGYRLAHGRIQWLSSPQSLSKEISTNTSKETRSLRERLNSL